MSRFIAALSTCMIAFAVAGGSAEAAAPPLTKAQKVAVKQAIVACKAEAKGQKIAWLSRRKYVNRCVADALKEHPTIDVIQILKQHPEMRDLPMDNWDSI
ncbi:hypothetical protein LPJ38_19580 [Bradyrhizobium daqingense]|uniref:Uncharacterized protein n=1 Tax=Bradyrhizobium daqingense TaxID=993502 RepID=A0A562KW39_9BRAD|nr:hypothetical protein [Bradyrhizobium daqingense]TWH99630.1 hypothetical protein IQ17_05348 [Bradyrhizobium daqingense]UFS85899.1 hypothetical protein LPJ38_19580 [Bradyrhizobium daqingense]